MGSLPLLFFSLQLSEAELDVLGEGATYQERLEVLKQQQELIDEEAEQEQVCPSDARLFLPLL
jgi:hypothetical protein